MDYLRRTASKCFNALQAVALRSMDEELARRDGERGHQHLRWFTPEEAAVAEALARIIVPSDEESPGLDEIDVFGPPVLVALDNLVVASLRRQYLYSRGLLSFDMWALKNHGCKFAEMTKEGQKALFTAAQQIKESMSPEPSSLAKYWRKFHANLIARNGSLFAADLYPQIRSDCIQVFYTSRVSWVWLEYDGPPMDKGYPKLMARD